MTYEEYENIQVGDEIVRVGDSCIGYTQGKAYKVVAWHLGMVHVSDDDGTCRPVGRMGFSGGDWALHNVEVVKPGKAYEELEVGDVLKYTPSGRAPDRLTKGKEYEIVNMNGSYVVITADNGEKAGVSKSGYAEGRWVLVSPPMGNDRVCKHVLPEDYLSLVDLALETRDKEWYNELMKKAKEPV